MAVFAVDLTLSAPRSVQWAIPGNYDGLRSPIPLGLAVFSGLIAVPILGSGDQTAAQVIMTMPENYAFLPRNYALQFAADGLAQGFNTTGIGLYTGRDVWSVRGPFFSLTSIGEIVNGAVAGLQIWNPSPGSPKLMMLPGENLRGRLVDETSAGSIAGTLSAYAEFYVFKLDQIDKWELNTPIPVIAHTSF